MQRLHSKYATFSGFFGAQALSQALVVAAYPLLGRLYAPAEFGAYAFFSSICILFMVIVFFRLEQALVQATDAEEALRIRKACAGLFMLSFPLSLLLLSVFLSLPWLSVKDAGGFLLAFALYALGGGGSLLLQHELVRSTNFKVINRMRLVQAISMVTVAAGMAYLGYTSSGLIYALALSQVLMLFPAGKKISLIVLAPHLQTLQGVWQKYRDFPYFNAGSALVEAVGRHLPVWMLLALASRSDAGFYANAWKFLSLPAALLMPTLGMWLYRAWSAYREDQRERIPFFFRKIWLPGAVLGFWLSLLVMFFAEPILVTLLGADWRGVGVYGMYLAPIGLMQALYVPIEPLFKIHREQHWFLFLSSFQLLSRGLIFLIGLSAFTLQQTLLAYLITEAVLFVLVLGKAYQWVVPRESAASGMN